ENTNVGYKINGRQIILTQKKVQKVILENDIEDKTRNDLSEAIQYIVSGTVKDNQGQPLPVASIVEKGTPNGTQTDFDGNFSIQLKDGNAILLVSYIGFATKEIPVNGQSNFNIILEESAAGLDEVVVVGYGTMKKTDLTGSISSVSSESVTQVKAISN